jgi:6-phosphogluconate dehydrogenase
MLPAGAVTEKVVGDLGGKLSSGDILIDGGNSFYKGDVRRAKALAPRGVRYVDVGTSGGVWGIDRGYCLMIGGGEATVRHLDPIFATLSPGVGKIERTPGREKRDPPGHFAKMIHNGIEYGLMQAFAEGFDILKNRASETLPADERYAFDLADIAEVWRRGSVVSSWLLDLCAIALTEDGELKAFTGSVADSGEGRWTIEAAIEEAVSADVLAASLFARFRSRRDHTFAEKLLSAMRNQFGGHVEAKK